MVAAVGMVVGQPGRSDSILDQIFDDYAPGGRFDIEEDNDQPSEE